MIKRRWSVTIVDAEVHDKNLQGGKKTVTLAVIGQGSKKRYVQGRA